MGLLPNFKKYYLENDEAQYLEILSSIKTLYESMRSFEKNSSKSLFLVKDSLEFLEILNNSGQNLNNIYKHGSGGVNLMTAHSSKGLEFDYVFIIDAAESLWKGKKRGSKIKAPLNIPIGSGKDDEDDFLRLLFVAATRAKNDLIITIPKETANKKALENLSFLEGLESEEVDNLDSSKLNTKEDSDNLKLQSFHHEIEKKLRLNPKTKINTNQLLKGRLENYMLSVTHLNNFLNIYGYDDENRAGPEYFRDTNLLNFPSYKPPSARYGTAIHETLSIFIQNELKNINDKEEQVLKILEIFKKRLLNQRMEKEEYSKLLEKGNISLRNYWKRSDYDLEKYEYKFEFSFSKQEVFLDDAHLTGSLDVIRIDKKTNEILVIDFKTGGIIDDFDKKTRDHKHVKQQSYKRQLLFYNILLSRSKSFHDKSNKLVKGRLEFIDAKPNEEYIVELEYNREEILRLEEIIKIVWSKIMKLDFQNTNELYENKYTSIQKFIDDLLEGKV